MAGEVALTPTIRREAEIDRHEAGLAEPGLQRLARDQPGHQKASTV
ncbi:MAG: hypothetical protein IOC52_09300 [Methylobacterium sp.]|nr:hypothetical protein [Methylobacterium sp.]